VEGGDLEMPIKEAKQSLGTMDYGKELKRFGHLLDLVSY
jgi:hypothetical protein